MEIQIYECSECGSQKLLYFEKNGDTVCSDCGLVLAEKQVVDLKKGMKPGTYKDSYGPKQAPWVPEKDRGSIIIVKKDRKDKEITARRRGEILRWKKLQRSRYIKEGSLEVGLALFRKITKQLDTPENIRLDAVRIFLDASKKKLISGRTYEGIIGASILFAYRRNDHLKSITKLSEEILIPQKNILRCYKVLKRELNIKVNVDFRPEKFVPRFCSEVNADTKIEKKAIEIIKEFKSKVNISGKDPKGIAVGAIYLVSEIEYKKSPENYKKITQKELASAGGVTEVTLRNRYKQIKKALSLI